ncbi:MAG: aspartate--tRNA ligase [Candidatus Binataceae bacterium]|nr:aspartate--tRNA ligase [Candidatus Binataceae bacterium]
MSNSNTFSPLPPWPRSDYCGALRAIDENREVALWGWVGARRDHGGLIFIDLRDREGAIQVVFNPERASAAHTVAAQARSEFYLAIRGKVLRRSSNTVNPELATGDIEVAAVEAQILNPSWPMPLHLDAVSDEQLRLKYRYLDLRRPEMQRNLRIRHQAVRGAREFLDGQGFIEIETPILWRATPEGARDYLVPSRVNPGKFYALPQSPQLLKQVLMVGGFDRYYQIARCFRDEDLRANRQPEFTQIDIEMTGPRPQDVMAVGQGMMASIYRAALGAELELPFPQMKYGEAMDRFGSDKPDLRFGLELRNLTSAFGETQFRVFAETLAGKGVIYGIALPAGMQLARRELDELAESLRARSGLGLAWARIAGNEWQGPIARHLSATERAQIADLMELADGATLLMVAGSRTKVRPVLGEVRLQLGSRFELRKSDQRRFLWVTDFPLFDYSEEDRRLVSVNHPFTAPHPEDLDRLDSDPLKVRALAYDMVLNGEELGGGSIRIHNRELQLKIFEQLGLTREEALEKFGFLLDALSYGAPPHGGIAFGVERISMLLCGTDSIRDVMAFPKTQKAVDLMSGAPSEVGVEQLRDLAIKVTI